MKFKLRFTVFACLTVMALVVADDLVGGNDRETGKDCYNGVKCSVTPCPGGVCKDIKGEQAVLKCKNCCVANGCNGSNDSGWCQDFCSGTSRSILLEQGIDIAIFSNLEASDTYVNAMIARYLNNEENLTDVDVAALDLVLANADIESAYGEHVGRHALSLLLLAYYEGRIDTTDSDRLDLIVGQIHHVTLFDMGDCGLRRDARGFGAQNGIQGDRDPIEDRNLIIQQIILEGLEGTERDPNLFPLLLNN